MKYWLVVPAAGASRRFGAGVAKQYLPLAGRTVIEWALSPFLGDGRCTGCAVAVAANDTEWPRLQARLASIGQCEWMTVTGGATRAESVRAALTAIAQRSPADTWVLVHDAARPCVTAQDVERLLATSNDASSGGLLAVPLADTLKRDDGQKNGNGGKRVAATVARERLWRALTPQMFRLGELCAALDAARAAHRTPTDEAQAIEWQGGHVNLIEGTAANLKITTPADHALAEAWLAKANA